MQKEIRDAINRANAQNSTGPKTIDGKRRSAMNACKHNLTGQSLILQPDETEAYNRLTNALVWDLKPLTELERQTVQKIVDAHFRLNRLAGVENNIFNLTVAGDIAGTPAGDRIDAMIAQTRAWIERSASFDVLGRYEARLARYVLQYTLELERLQAARRARDLASGHHHDKKRDKFELAGIVYFANPVLKTKTLPNPYPSLGDYFGGRTIIDGPPVAKLADARTCLVV